MPSRNVVREDVENSFYHIYGKGSLGRAIFKTDGDKMAFFGFLQRYLDLKIEKKRNGTPYQNYHGKVDLLAYCVMDSDFHLLLWQQEVGLISELMKSVLVSYTMYYNKKYGVSGQLLESRFKAVRIDEDENLLHLTRYIHLVPSDFRDYLWSSLGYYVAGLEEEWVRPDKIIEKFDLTYDGYWDMLKDYEEKDSLDELKSDFADSGKSIDSERMGSPF